MNQEKVKIRKPDGTTESFMLSDEKFTEVESGGRGLPSFLMKLSKEKCASFEGGKKQ